MNPPRKIQERPTTPVKYGSTLILATTEIITTITTMKLMSKWYLQVITTVITITTMVQVIKYL